MQIQGYYPQPFKDLTVIELSTVLAGPSVGMFFAELGAKVIKIENPKTGGDITRKWKGPSESQADNFSAYYRSVNWGKEVLFIDLSTAEGKATLFELLTTADIVVSNFRSASALKLGITPEKLQRINPALIQVNLTGYGEADNRPAYDAILQAETGFMYLNGYPGAMPSKMPVALIDLLAAHQMKEAVLIALLERGRTGKGQYIGVNLAQSAMASLANQASNWLNAKVIPKPMGTAHPNIAPYGDLFLTLDQQYILLAIGSDAQFQSLCDFLKMPDLAEDDRFSTNRARVINRSLLAQALQEAIKQHKLADLMAALPELNVPVTYLRNMKEVFSSSLAEELILEYPDHKTRAVRSATFQFYYEY